MSDAISVQTPATQRARRRVRTGRVEYSRRARLSLGAASVVIVFSAWEGLARLLDLDPLFLPRFSAALEALQRTYEAGILVPNLLTSANLYVVSMAISIAVAVPLGIVVGAVDALNRVATPWLWAIYTTPGIIFLPLILLWVGINDTARMLIILISAIPPMAVIVIEGVKTVDPSLIRVGQTFGGSRGLILRTVVLPATMPYVGTGVRMGVSRGLVGLFGAELFTAQTGLGFIIVDASRRFDTPLVFGILLVYVVFCSVLISASGVLERRLSAWRD